MWLEAETAFKDVLQYFGEDALSCGEFFDTLATVCLLC